MTTKLVLLGDSGVGKTLFLHAATKAKPGSVTGSSIFKVTQFTIGVDFCTTTRPLADNEAITLQVWDTAGQERFHAVSTCYMRGASAILLFYAVNDRASFDNLGKRWLHRIQDLGSARRPPPVFLVGTKTDLPASKHVVADDEASAMSAALGAKLSLRTSALSSNGNYARTTLDIVAAYLVKTGCAYPDSGPNTKVRRHRPHPGIVVLDADDVPSNAKRRCAC